LRPIFCGLGLGLGLEGAGLGLGLGLGTTGLGLGLGLEVSVLNYFSRPPMYLPNPFHMVACLFLPVTQVTKIQNASVKAILSNDQFKCQQQFVSRKYCVPATSASVERIFSHGGIFMRPHRARMSDSGHV